MNVELVAQMFKNYQSNVLFHLEGECVSFFMQKSANMGAYSYGQLERAIIKQG